MSLPCAHVSDEAQEIAFDHGDSLLEELSGQSSLSSLKGELETAVSHYLNQVKDLGYYKDSGSRDKPCSFTTFKTPALPHRTKSRPAPNPPDSNLDVQFKLDTFDLTLEDEDSFTEDEEDEGNPPSGQEGLDNPLYLSLRECSTGPLDSFQEPLYENGSLVNSDDDHIYENVDIDFHLYDTVANPPRPKLPPKPGHLSPLVNCNQNLSLDIGQNSPTINQNTSDFNDDKVELSEGKTTLTNKKLSEKTRSTLELEGSETSDLGSSGSDVTSEEDWPLPPTPPQVDTVTEELPLPLPPPEIALQQLEDEVLRAEQETKKLSLNAELLKKLNSTEDIHSVKENSIKSIKSSRLPRKSSSFSGVREEPFLLSLEEDCFTTDSNSKLLREESLNNRQLKKRINTINKGLSTYKEAIKRRDYKTLPKTNSIQDPDNIITPAIRHSVIIELKDSCAINPKALKPSEIKRKDNSKVHCDSCLEGANLILKEVAGVCVNVKQSNRDFKTNSLNNRISAKDNEQIIEISEDGTWEMKDTNSSLDSNSENKMKPDIDPFTGQPILNALPPEEDKPIKSLEEANLLHENKISEKTKNSEETTHSNGSDCSDDSGVSNSSNSCAKSKSTGNADQIESMTNGSGAKKDLNDNISSEILINGTQISPGNIVSNGANPDFKVMEKEENYDESAKCMFTKEDLSSAASNPLSEGDSSITGGKNLGAAIMEEYEKDINRKKESLNLPEISMLEFGESAKDMEIQRRTVIQQMTVKAKKKDSWIRDFRAPNSKDPQRHKVAEKNAENDDLEKKSTTESEVQERQESPEENGTKQEEKTSQMSSQPDDKEPLPEISTNPLPERESQNSVPQQATPESSKLPQAEQSAKQFEKKNNKLNSKKTSKEGFLGKCLRKEKKAKAPEPPNEVPPSVSPKESQSNSNVESKGEVGCETRVDQKESTQADLDGNMLTTVDDGGWEPVANVKFQSEPGLIVEMAVDPEISEDSVPPPPQFQAEAEINFSSISTQETDKCPSLSDVGSKTPKQYVYGSDEDTKPKVAPTTIAASQLLSKIPSHENLIEAEIREQQMREETLRQEAALRSREKTGGASSPSSHTSDEGFVDRPPEEIPTLITTTGSPSQGFTHTVTGSNGEPVIYDAISPVSDIYSDKDSHPIVSHTSETKIALEIRELREREAELRAMRELRQQELEALSRPQIIGGEEVEAEEEEDPEIESSSTRDLIEDHLTSLTTTTDEGNYSECGDPASSEDKSSDGSNSRIMSPDLHSSFVSSHSDSRQRRITVKPYEDAEAEAEDQPIYTRMKKESVIEREIRLASEREEAFRKEKGLPSLPSEGTRVFIKSATALKSSSTSIILDTSKDKHVLEEPPRRSIKHLLASSFIQQEIQETSQRERELKSSGQIRTLSEDTVDSKVTRMSDLSAAQTQKLRLSTSTTTIVPTQKSLTLPKSPATHTPLIRKNSPLSPSSPYAVPSFTPSPVQKLPAPTRLTRSLSTNNLSAPFGGAATGAFRPKGLMQKFIASRGKLIAPTFANATNSIVTPPYRTAPSPPPPSCANGIPTRPMKLQPKNLVVRKELEDNSQEDSSTKIYRRTHTTAEEKIQEELREMKNREEELRRLRARNLARSQPNLAGLIDHNDDDASVGDYEEDVQGDPCVVNGVDSTSLHPQVNGLRAALSNPNLLDVETEAPLQPATVDKGTRRKSALIAHWEGRIQQTSET